MKTVNISITETELFSSKLNSTNGKSIWLSLCLLCVLLIPMNSIGQETTSTKQETFVSGVVTDDIGPLADVNIVVKGTLIGTATDEKGRFKFREALVPGVVLRFTYLGYAAQEIKVTDTTTPLKVNMSRDDFSILGAPGSKKPYKSKRRRN